MLRSFSIFNHVVISLASSFQKNIIPKNNKYSGIFFYLSLICFGLLGNLFLCNHLLWIFWKHTDNIISIIWSQFWFLTYKVCSQWRFVSISIKESCMVQNCCTSILTPCRHPSNTSEYSLWRFVTSGKTELLQKRDKERNQWSDSILGVFKGRIVMTTLLAV